MGEAKRRKARDPNYGKQRVDLSKQKEQIEMMFAISLSSLGFMHTLNSNISEILEMAETLYKEIPLEELELQEGSFFDSVPMQLRGEITEKTLKIVALFVTVRQNPPLGYSQESWLQKIQSFFDSQEAIMSALHNASPIRKQVTEYLVT
ncbi:hypothetical protein H6G91_40445 [Nostoc muscorum FACHB-395]|jgi:hypothetical protein|uniref:hypothetical protein n=1 Tax=Nostoc sp. C057 TaxID=2576903 RepID=UPI0015C321D0|nr:hypothetical protein [Nostoc sp. C057]MBD2513349.1 hypothetical protein [Desmonostoc muscorum FACHB-395]QLE53479.1 hypothetical protein FD724_36865 [Nostoc sp. C057]